MISLHDLQVNLRQRPQPAPPGEPRTTQVVVEALEHPLCDARGEPLPIGCALELGFFSRGQMATPFRGRWLPLAGRFTVEANRRIQFPRIGDGGAGPGRFTWCHTFEHGVESLAPVSTPLAIRFYDSLDPQAARTFNTVSNASWWCRAPKAGTPALVYMSLDFEGTVWESGAHDDFRTTLPVFGSMFSRLMTLGAAPGEHDL